MADRKPRITKEMRSRFLRLAEKAEPQNVANAVEVHLREVIKEATKHANTVWPKKDMKVLEKHGFAKVRDSIHLSFSTGGTDCGACSSLTIPAKGDLKRPLPYEKYNGTRTLDAPKDSLLEGLAQEHSGLLRELREANDTLRKALSDLIYNILVPGKPLDRLDTLTKAWPSPEVKELVNNIKAGELPMEAKKAQAVVAEAYA